MYARFKDGEVRVLSRWRNRFRHPKESRHARAPGVFLYCGHTLLYPVSPEDGATLTYRSITKFSGPDLGSIVVLLIRPAPNSR